jgi:superfamily II DNA or RNA helicase
MVDESHTFGAETLEEICYGVLAEVPYRMFFSGTQTRNDGAEKLLQSIIGQTVHTLTTREAIAGGYICPHDYRIVNIESSNPNYATQDVLDMKRKHFLKNRNICAFIAKLCNAAALSRHQTLVLVEELEQISMLLKLLKVPTVYAHSEKKPDRLATLDLSKVDPGESVEKFNKGEAMVLIGTSCIATGTNIYPMRHTINWVGGTSEIKTKQGAIGRSVRLGSHNPWRELNERNCSPKTITTIWDFNVFDIFVMSRHLEDRLPYYHESGTEIKTIDLKK